MSDLVRFFVCPEGAPPIELESKNWTDAAEEVKRNFRGSGMIRVTKQVWRCVSQEPQLINCGVEQ